MGTACFVKGAAQLLESLAQQTHLAAGQTSADQRVSLLTARCIGACGIAPAVVYDHDTAGHQTPEDVVTRVKGWLTDGAR
jgi:bidirectional [NiFe] hydrogenase diaphorase subunit